jgi:hypothetical protein
MVASLSSSIAKPFNLSLAFDFKLRPRLCFRVKDRYKRAAISKIRLWRVIIELPDKQMCPGSFPFEKLPL